MFTAFALTVFLGASILSAIIVRAAIRYAQRRSLVDLPGARRSHAQPTARGGGIGIVVAVALLGVAGFRGVFPDAATGAIALLPFLAVAAIGWVDDHRALGAVPRLLVHVLAAIATVFALPGSLGWIVACGVVLAVAWSINLHNFMDGINGLLACQAAFVAAALAAFAFVARDPGVLILACAVSGACLGFLPFNFPRARIFMGDVGSGALGYAIALLSVAAVLRGTVSPASALILSSAFVTDATLTLLSRMAQRRRWYSAHREHLYQWLVRSGWSHARTTLAYLGWNFAVALPLAIWLDDATGLALAYGLGIVAWSLGKRSTLTRVRRKMVPA